MKKFLIPILILAVASPGLLSCTLNIDLDELAKAYGAIYALPSCVSVELGKVSKSGQSTLKPSNQLEVFAPIRWYVFIADAGASFAKEIIGELRTHTLPDSYDAVGEDGERWVITTPGGTFDSVTYDKKIELYTVGGQKYFEINYMKNEARGIVVCKPNVKNPSRLITGASIYFDGRGDTKIMEVKLTAVEPEISIDGWLSHLHLYITKTDAIYTLEGGAQANEFVFNDDGYNPFTQNRTYMIKAKADGDANLAVTYLGFPESTVSLKTNLYGTYYIAYCFRELFLEWVKANGPKGTSGTLYYNVDQELFSFNLNWDQDPTELKSAIESYVLEMGDAIGTDFFFLSLDLENPVGFDSNGYHSNGSTLDPKFDYLSTGFSMDASISASEIGSLVVDFGS
jgi:hypothetical protein